MKTFAKLYVLGVILLSSLMFISCQKEDNNVDVKNYSFGANIEVIDGQGTEFEVGEPIKFRITLNNVKDRGDSIGVSFNVGERKGRVYTENHPDRKFAQNTTFNDEFLNNSVILNYIPRNGGTQTIKFILTNGKYRVEISKQIKVNTGSNITFVPLTPLTQILDKSSSMGKITIDNYKDEDNYYNVVYEVLDGHYSSQLTFKTSEGVKVLYPKDTLRILTGKDTKSFVYSYTQYKEGHNTIKLSVIDRYGNEVSRTYELFYAPVVHINLFVEGSEDHFDERLKKLGVLSSFSFKLGASAINELNKPEPYSIHSEQIKVEFDMTYFSYYSRKEETKHITLKIDKDRSSGDFFFPNFLKNEELIAAYKMQSRKIRFSNFEISGLKDEDGRTYVFDGFIKYKEVKSGSLWGGGVANQITTYSEDIKVQ